MDVSESGEIVSLKRGILSRDSYGDDGWSFYVENMLSEKGKSAADVALDRLHAGEQERKYLVAEFAVAAFEAEGFYARLSRIRGSEIGFAHALVTLAPGSPPMTGQLFAAARLRMLGDFTIAYGNASWVKADD
ncbi:MAG TPA: hypothetical protein DEP66_00260 [Acidimicrobiaceae bacterium]|nr:hypothetical protein [Acidimicrobiaceae bacterium]HCB36679.1 hypothetical protein [Acidimicrobiaceae bacterium]